MPPTGKISPLKVISPVKAISFGTFFFFKRLIKDVVIETPALGPFIGIAPIKK